MSEAVLLAISDEIAISLEKASRKRRASINLKRAIRRNEGKMARAARKWLAWMADQARPELSKMRGKNPTRMVENLADWDEINAVGKDILKPIMFEIMAKGGRSVVDRQIIKQERFDPIGVAAVKWADKYAAKQVVEITNKTMEAIRYRIRTGLNAGESVNTIAMDLRNLVGLTKNQIIANANFEEQLIINRPEYTAAQIRRSTEVHARRQHRRRAMTIGRTETAGSLNEGILQGYDQMGVKQVERVEDIDAPDDDCIDNNGRIYSLSEAQGVLPAHPNCEGVWVAA